MTKPAFDRDNILTLEERATSARKCLSILADANLDKLRDRDREFINGQRSYAKSLRYEPSERVLAYLRDLTNKAIGA